MIFTFYDGTIAVAQNILGTLVHILKKAEHGPNADTLLSARLHEDMYPLTDQIRIASQFSENLAAKLTGRAPVVFQGDLTTFAKCYERIDAALKAVNEADKNVVNQHSEVVSSTPLGPGKSADMSGAAYAHTIVLPNIYFHLSIAYGILRKEGVPLGKGDYYEGFFPNYFTSS